MKPIRKLVAFLVVAIMLTVAMPLASATTGGPCTITFSLRNDSGSVIEDDIHITLTSQTTSRAYTVTITADEYNYDIPVLWTVPQGSVYDISIAYKSSYTGFYQIVNSDGSQITTFDANSDKATLSWKLIFVGNTAPVVDTLDEEVPLVWQDFMESWTAHGMYAATAENPFLFDFVKNMEKGFSEHYEIYCGKVASDWLAMSLDEQTLVWLVWILPNQKIAAVGAQSLYFENQSDFLNRGLSLAFSVLSYYDGEVTNAYKDLMIWQYNYIIRRGKPYNFVADITERNVPETLPATIPTEPVETMPSFTVPMESEISGNPGRQKGFWEKTFDASLWAGVGQKLMGNIGTIVLMVVFVVGLLVILYIRKKKNIDGEDAGDE